MKITFLGDIMIDNATAETMDKYITDGKFCFDSMFQNVTSLLCESDYVFANLETPISCDNSDLTNVQWQFCSPREFAEAVKNAGVDFVSTANNHCLDRGINGLKTTLHVLDEIGLKHTGTYYSSQEKKACVIEANELKIGCLAYTYGTNAISNHNYLGINNRKMVDLIQEQEGYIDIVDPTNKLAKRNPKGIVARVRNKVFRVLFPENIGKEWYEKRTIDWYRKYLLKKDIRKLKKKSDLIIIMLHIGGQYNKEPNEYTTKMIDWLFEKKIDIVIANHEHVIHPHKFIKDTNQFAGYAIGNFISGSGTICAPYDKRSEYSIAIHFYYERNSIVKISFSVLKTIIDESEKLAIHIACDLLEKCTCPKKLENEILDVVHTFSGRNYTNIEKEYVLYENTERK